MHEDPDEFQRLRREQDGVFGVAQLAALGLSENVVRANIAAGRWIPLFRGVVATTNAEPTPAMWRRAALLFVPGPAVLSHGSAAAVLGLRGGDDALPVHVTSPFTASGRGCAGVVVHRSRAFAHIAQRGSDPPVTTRAQTLIDLAVAVPTGREAQRTLAAGATAAKVPAASLAAVLEQRPPRRYRKALRDTVGLLLDGVESMLEADYANLVERAHGLPCPTRQVPRVLDGTPIAEDLEYDLPGGTLTVRLDGWRYHRDRRTAHLDRRRDNAAELEGRARLVFGTEEVQGAPCTTAATVALRLAQLGWTGVLGRCAACVHFPSSEPRKVHTRAELTR